MQTLNRQTICAFLALAWIGTATAQTTEEDLALAYGDKSMISIATGSPQPITRAPAVATVITARDIAALGATDLDQVLVNGIPITNVLWGDRGEVWGGMPLENVARIEVIRGPGSALYGADAFSGVINVITKTAADIKGTEYGLRAGSFNSREAWIQHGDKLGKLDAAFYLSAGNTDGQKGIIQRDAQTAWDGILATNASRAPGPINAE